MSTQPRQIAIRLLDKEYMIACPDGAEAELLASADYLNQKMQETKEHGKAIGLERIAIMAALNMSHELLRNRADDRQHIEDQLRHLGNKIDQALDKSSKAGNENSST